MDLKLPEVCGECGEKFKDGQILTVTTIVVGTLIGGELVDSQEISKEATHSDCSEVD